MFVKNKKGFEGEKLVKWIIAILLLALVIFLIIRSSQQGGGFIDKILALFRFRN